MTKHLTLSVSHSGLLSERMSVSVTVIPYTLATGMSKSRGRFQRRLTVSNEVGSAENHINIHMKLLNIIFTYSCKYFAFLGCGSRIYTKEELISLQVFKDLFSIYITNTFLVYE